MAVSSSGPLITDICTSAITHDVSFKRADRKNSSADANVWTAVYPCDLRRLLVAARTDASSSMTDITESVDKAAFLTRVQSAYRSTAAQREDGSRIKLVKLYLGLYALALGVMDSKRFGLSHQIGQ